MAEVKTNVRQIRQKKTAKTAGGEQGATLQQNCNKTATELPPIRYAFAPLLQQFRSHTKKNEARLWMPIETNLIFRYEFAALSPQNRYIFVAILLYCAGNGIDEFPLDAKFMANILIVDERMLGKSFDELLFQKLLLEKTEKTEKKSTDRQDASAGGVSVDVENSFSEQSENENENGNGNGNGKNEDIFFNDVVPADSPIPAKKNLSKFSIEECLEYVERCVQEGESVKSPKALANHLFKTGEADSFIFRKLFPADAEIVAAEKFGEPINFLDEPCNVCFGAKMADTDGNGYRACAHCRNERGLSTGREPVEAKEKNDD